MNYKTVLLNGNHKKDQFSCGQNLLDTYLHKQATQDSKRYITACFVMAGIHNEVKGYYTLSNSSIAKDFVPDALRNKLPPSYIDLPVTLLGRLARDKQFSGEGLGEILLLDALKRSYDASLTIGSMAVIVDPIDDFAISFYTKYGFVYLPDKAKMFLSMKLIAELFKNFT